MPHLLIEYTEPLAPDAQQLLAAANAALLQTGEFGEADIKSRCLRLPEHRHGVEARRSAFVHATLSVMSGRTSETRRRIAQAVCDAIVTQLPPCRGHEVQVSVDIREMQRDTYAKSVLPPA